MLYSWLLLIHILAAGLIVGGGLVALLMLGLCLRDPALLPALRLAARLDFAIIGAGLLLQPVTGLWLAREAGFSLGDGWLAEGIGLYALAACLWLVGVALRNDGLKLRETGEPGDRRLWSGLALSVCAWTLFVATMGVMVLKP